MFDSPDHKKKLFTLFYTYIILEKRVTQRLRYVSWKTDISEIENQQ